MRLCWWLMMLALPLTHGDTNWSGCPSVCRCMWSSGKKMAECSSQGLTAVPDGLSNEIQSINLSSNALHSLPREVFSRVGLINLQKIFLRHCRIQELHKDAFKSLDLLVELDLSNNLIHYLHPDTFRDNVRLRVLIMHHNAITKLEDRLFSNMTYLHTVDMNDCRLAHLGNKTFVNVPYLRDLYLAGNNLVQMNVSTVEPLDRLMTLLLHNNPWRCDCHLQAFRNWTMEMPLDIQPTACAFPPHLAGRLWTEITSKDFACGSQDIYSEKFTTTEAYGEEVTIGSRGSGDPEREVYSVAEIAVRESIVDDIVHVGCYDLEYSIDHNFHQYMKDPNLEKCSSYCCRLKTQYAGIEKNGGFCYCGNEIAEKSRKQNASLCSVSCPDAELQKCGGESVMSLYNISGVPECTTGGRGNSISVPGTSFLVGTESGVMQYNFDDITLHDVIISTRERVVSVDYHLARKLVFYHSNHTVYRTTMEPSANNVVKTATPIATTTGCDAIAVDWVSDKILFCDNSTIMSIGLDGGESTVLYRKQERGLINRLEVDPLEGIIFWSVRGTIESYQYKEPKKFRGNLSDKALSVRRTLALDMRSHRVYYVAEVGDLPALFSVNYEGGDHCEHMSISQLSSTYGIGIVKGHIFWLSYVTSMDELYGAPLPLNGTDDVQRLTSIDQSVWHMKVIHPELQKILAVDPGSTTPSPQM